MLRKLRHKFIFINMLLVGVVLHVNGRYNVGYTTVLQRHYILRGCCQQVNGGYIFCRYRV